MKRPHGNIGKKRSKEHKEIISLANKNKVLSEETKRRISNTRKNRKYDYGFVKGHIPWNKGKKVIINHSAGGLMKMSLSKVGDKNPMKRTEVRNKNSLSHIGKKLTMGQRLKISSTMKKKYFLGEINSYLKGRKGDLCRFWRGGISFEPYGLEFNKELKEEIRKRDNYVCQKCSEIQGNRKLEVHHIDYNKKNNKSYNLISLCSVCHRKTNHNREYWEKYFKNFIEENKLKLQVQPQ